MRLCLFGGSFDPVHQGHLAMARQALRELRLDLMVWVPAGDPPHKRRKSLAPAFHRLHMLELATAGMERMRVSDCELLRSGPSYTADTLGAFRSLHPGARIFFLLGSDSLAHLPSWHDAARLLEFELVVAPRPGFEPAGVPAAFRKVMRVLRGPDSPAASRRIRSRFWARGGAGADLAPVVRQYIRVHRLYQGAS